MAGQVPVRRRLVGGALRRYRENVGYTLEDAAGVLECDRSKISRIETGQRGVRPKELRELLAEYGVGESEQHALAAIAGRGSRHAWWRRHADVMSETCLDYVIVESAASEIMTYEAQVIPDLLQTDDYARAMAAALPGVQDGQHAESVVAAKAARRRAVLGEGTSQAAAGGNGGPKEPLRLGVVLGEGALHQAVGGSAVMDGQLRHLAAVGAEYPAVTIQVLPFSAGAHAAAGSGSLAILRFCDAPSLGVVYLETLSGGVFLDSGEAVARYLRAFALLRAAALSPADSAALLRSLSA
ncbi:MAG: helix-turn-helix domain-containing protein [Streptosporangiaceae bacterium]|nr:helix-turn-helix domain-containing protein [Streptosporangiaceae bacterium]